jgi:hypothetical protein
LHGHSSIEAADTVGKPTHGGSHRCDPAVGTVSGGRRERDLTGVDAAITDELAVESRRREV